MHSKRNSAPTL